MASESELSPSSAALLDEILDASDYPDALARDEARTRVSEAIGEVVTRLRAGERSVRHAKRLHRILHRDYLKTYDPDADRLDAIVADGRFNCLSATLFFGLAAAELGYRPDVIETPGHLFLSMRIHDRVVDIETTSSAGFDVGYRFKGSGAGLADQTSDLRWLDERAVTRPIGDAPLFWRVALEQSVGFAWLNHAWRAVHDGQTVAAAQAVLRADRYLDQLGPRAKGVDRLLTHAFRMEYDAGRFDRAYDVAAAALTLYPYSTSVEDRVLASALKRIQSRSDENRPSDGQAILDGLHALPLGDVGRDRLAREAVPYLTRAFVRIGDLAGAREMAARFAEVEPDAVEVERLADWVESRSLSTD